MIKRFCVLVVALWFTPGLFAQAPGNPCDYHATIVRMTGELRRSLLVVSLADPEKIKDALVSELTGASVASIGNAISLESRQNNDCELPVEEEHQLTANLDFAGIFEIASATKGLPIPPGTKVPAEGKFPFRDVVFKKLQRVQSGMEKDSPYWIAGKLLEDPGYKWPERARPPSSQPSILIPVNPSNVLNNSKWSTTLNLLHIHEQKGDAMGLLQELRGFYLFDKAPTEALRSLEK
jgi:hypothetical protein